MPEPDAAPAEIDADDARRLIDAIVGLATMADRVLPRRGDPLVERLRDHLGIDGTDTVPNTSLTLPSIEHANLQLALDAQADEAGGAALIGLTPDIGHFGGVSLTSLVAGDWQGPGETARQYVEAEVGPGATMRCLRAGIVLTSHDGGPVAAMLYVSDRGMLVEVVVEVIAAEQHVADGFVARLRHLMDELNVLRGKTLAFSFGRHGEFGLSFVEVAPVGRDDVVLPDDDLTAIEQHALGISEHAGALRAAGQHVKRGLLLHGPPGTGKSHTVNYLLNAMPGRTAIVISGPAVRAIGQAGTIARSLQPATIVIEDVDLVALDRDLPMGEHNPMLFMLLNEMDGLAADADVLFVLTTNRVDILEPALAARPGRIDQAIEIGLPDGDARGRLFDLYGGELPSDVRAAAVADTDGVAAAFVKEACRRAHLTAVTSGGVVGDHLVAAVDALRRQSTPVLRRSLTPTAD